MLFQELGKMKRTWIMTSIILIAFGIVMMLCPVRYMQLMISALGYMLLVATVVMCLDFLSSKKTLMNYVLLTLALFVGILGLFICICPARRTGHLVGAGDHFRCDDHTRSASSGKPVVEGFLPAEAGDRRDAAVLFSGKHYQNDHDLAVQEHLRGG